VAGSSRLSIEPTRGSTTGPLTTPAADSSLTKWTTGAAIAARVECRRGLAWLPWAHRGIGSVESCFVLDVRPMRLRRAPGTRERRRVAQPVVHPQPSSIRRCGVVAEAVFEADIPLPNVANL
jgi:hypothetical protein